MCQRLLNLKSPITILRFSRIILAICWVLCWSFTTSGQDKASLEEEKSKIEEQIRLAEKFLSENRTNKSVTLDEFKVIQKQIDSRKKLISTINEQLKSNSKSLNQKNKQLTDIQSRYDKLQTTYSEVMRAALRKKLTQNPWMFILSANSLKEAILRMRYTKQFETYCHEQSLALQSISVDLNHAIDTMKVLQNKQEELLNSENSQYSKLNTLLKEKDNTIAQLTKNEKKLKAELKTKNDQKRKLDMAIEDIILNEIKITKAEPTTENLNTLNDNIKVSGLFDQNKGKLPWPVKKGIVAQKFGKQAHPTLKNITIDNNGINIRTEKNAVIKSIFEGKVVGTMYVPGYNNMVIVQHGQYYTVYSKMDDIQVKKGDTIKRGQSIGKASVTDNQSEIHFEIWQEKSKLDPEKWLLKNNYE